MRPGARSPACRRAAAAGRLLLVGHDAFPAGAQQLLLHLARQWRRRHGVQPEFVLLAGGALLAEYEALGPVTIAGDDTALAAFLADRHASGLRRALVNTSVAAVSCMTLARLGIASTLLVHELPRLLAERDLLAAAAAGAAAADRVLFASAFVRDRFLAATGLDPARAEVIGQGCYRPVAPCGAARHAIRAELGIPADAYVAIGCGYADLRKGFDLFLRVWHATQTRCTGRRRRPVHLVWVGAVDPTVHSYLGAEMAAAEAAGSFHFTGWRDDVGALMAAADVMLLTSREDPFPAVVLEAMTGRPAGGRLRGQRRHSGAAAPP